MSRPYFEKGEAVHVFLPFPNTEWRAATFVAYQEDYRISVRVGDRLYEGVPQGLVLRPSAWTTSWISGERR